MPLKRFGSADCVKRDIYDSVNSFTISWSKPFSRDDRYITRTSPWLFFFSKLSQKTQLTVNSWNLEQTLIVDSVKHHANVPLVGDVDGSGVLNQRRLRNHSQKKVFCFTILVRLCQVTYIYTLQCPSGQNTSIPILHYVYMLAAKGWTDGRTEGI